MLLFAAACATQQPPAAQISAAAAVLAHGAGAGGTAFASADMQLARNKMQRANAAMTDKDYPMALARSREAPG
ncbi:hypothetical protein [Aquabacterium sp. OR-4]|uniref:hypothetical protein n=1 Tax=Aquabacterium sp. OR-4 TaxID=2978127 RepID=UPI0021B2CF57|nr:hypothetical protein [Aquabacterium sp. OR-4]MDT7834096.1 hypothetical protein [Aquabacterium sp. OR-4]